jgi:hypothetical protein
VTIDILYISLLAPYCVVVSIYTAGLKTKSSAFYPRSVHVCVQYSTMFPYTTFVPGSRGALGRTMLSRFFSLSLSPVFKLFSGTWTLASMYTHICKYVYPLYRILRNLWFIVCIYVDIERCIWWIFQRCNPEYIRESSEKPQTTLSVLRALSRTENIFGVIWFLSCSSWLSGEMLVAFAIRVAFKPSPETTFLVCTSQRTWRASTMRTNQWML